MSAVPSDRDARIASIIDAIAAGTYDVGDLEVADAVLERWRKFDVLTPVAVSEVGGAGHVASADADSSDASSR